MKHRETDVGVLLSAGSSLGRAIDLALPTTAHLASFAGRGIGTPRESPGVGFHQTVRFLGRWHLGSLLKQTT